MASSFLRNRIINGDMRIDQRNAGASLTNAAGSVNPVDRWKGNGTVASKFTIQQNAGSITPPVGYSNYIGVTSSSAYSVIASDQFNITQWIEGYNIADLNMGTANAKTFTCSFWVYSSLTGTFGGVFQGYNGSTYRSYPFSYTISLANTWTYVTITVPGDTTTFAYNTTNGYGLLVSFGLGAGSTFTGTSGAWASGNYYQPTSTVSVVGTSGATFYVTGVQLEVGTVATPFERQIYSTQLAQCQRYAYKSIGGTGTYCYFSAFGQVDTTTSAQFVANFPVPMRSATALSLTTTGTAANYYLYTNGALRVLNAVPVIGNSSASGEASQVSTSVASAVLVAGNATQLLGVNASSAYLLWTSEL
jgi:hypothetical protein